MERITRKEMIKMDNRELQEYFMESRVDREMVGFITSGGINFKLSRGYGIGMIKSDYNLPYALIRKPTSPFYFLAQLSP